MQTSTVLHSVRIFKELVYRNEPFPNNPLLPVVVYESVLMLNGENDADVIERLFAHNKWTNAWRDNIYDYHHYHSNTHEVMGIAKGQCKIQLGGEGGPLCPVERGDVLIIPAGVAHKNIYSSADFICIGAYPSGHSFDIQTGRADERLRAERSIARVALPATDPVYGRQGPLIKFWRHPG